MYVTKGTNSNAPISAEEENKDNEKGSTITQGENCFDMQKSFTNDSNVEQMLVE